MSTESLNLLKSAFERTCQDYPFDEFLGVLEEDRLSYVLDEDFLGSAPKEVQEAAVAHLRVIGRLAADEVMTFDADED